MPSSKRHRERLERLFDEIFSELGDYEILWEVQEDDTRCDLKIVSESPRRSYYFSFKVRERITPQIADDLFERLRQKPASPHVVRIVFAPVISPRVAEIARHHGVSFIDYAGNCRILDSRAGLLISRTGIKNEASSQEQQAVGLFSPKSSRIIRAMLHEPKRGWQVSELSDNPDAKVSVGLASKVKKALIRESYAIVKDRLLYLKQPSELLAAWTRSYPGPSDQRLFYMRGDPEGVERKIAAWCEESNIEYSLARFSAVWRHAPEVRHTVASLYVTSEALGPSRLNALREKCGAREVESGANLGLMTPYDKSVFVRRVAIPEQTTSPLQTYLDLQAMAGRGSEAAEAVFEKHLRPVFDAAGAPKGGSK